MRLLGRGRDNSIRCRFLRAHNPRKTRFDHRSSPFFLLGCSRSGFESKTLSRNPKYQRRNAQPQNTIADQKRGHRDRSSVLIVDRPVLRGLLKGSRPERIGPSCNGFVIELPSNPLGSPIKNQNDQQRQKRIKRVSCDASDGKDQSPKHEGVGNHKNKKRLPMMPKSARSPTLGVGSIEQLGQKDPYPNTHGRQQSDQGCPAEPAQKKAPFAKRFTEENIGHLVREITRGRRVINRSGHKRRDQTRAGIPHGYRIRRIAQYIPTDTRNADRIRPSRDPKKQRDDGQEDIDHPTTEPVRNLKPKKFSKHGNSL